MISNFEFEILKSENQSAHPYHDSVDQFWVSDLRRLRIFSRVEFNYSESTQSMLSSDSESRILPTGADYQNTVTGY